MFSTVRDGHSKFAHGLPLFVCASFGSGPPLSGSLQFLWLLPSESGNFCARVFIPICLRKFFLWEEMWRRISTSGPGTLSAKKCNDYRLSLSRGALRPVLLGLRACLLAAFCYSMAPGTCTPLHIRLLCETLHPRRAVRCLKPWFLKVQSLTTVSLGWVFCEWKGGTRSCAPCRFCYLRDRFSAR